MKTYPPYLQMSDVQKEEWRKEWKKINEVAHRVINNRQLGDKLRQEANELYKSGKFTNRIDAMQSLLEKIAENENKNL